MLSGKTQSHRKPAIPYWISRWVQAEISLYGRELTQDGTLTLGQYMYLTRAQAWHNKLRDGKGKSNSLSRVCLPKVETLESSGSTLLDLVFQTALSKIIKNMVALR